MLSICIWEYFILPLNLALLHVMQAAKEASNGYKIKEMNTQILHNR